MQLPPLPEPSSLVVLCEAFEKTKHKVTGDNLKELLAALREASRYCALVNDANTSAEVANMWLATCQLEMQFKKDPYPRDSVVDYVTGLIQNIETLSMVCANDANAKLLAFSCLRALVDIKTKEREGSNSEIARVFSLWTGKTVKEGRGLTIKSAVQHLYGKAVYDLYRADVPHENKLPELLYTLDVPLLGVTTRVNPAGVETHVEFPNQMVGNEYPGH